MGGDMKLINEQEINCVQDMVKEAIDLQKQGRSIYFRGQDYYKDKNGKEELHLIPSIGKEYEFVVEKKTFGLESEKNLLHRFCRYAYIESKRALSEWEALFLARHHGLPTRLLDWTANPLIALFFAAQCRERKGDAAVWAIVKNDVKDIDLLAEADKDKKEINIDELYYQSLEDLPLNLTYEKKEKLKIHELQNPLRLKGVHILYPFYVSPRMIMQHSFFTIQDDPWCPLDDYHSNDGYLKQKQDFIHIDYILRWKVPTEARPGIIHQLERLGIDNRTIFPDLDGLAKGLWQLEILREHNTNPKQ